MQTRGRLYRHLRDRFRAAGLPTADLDARLLAAAALGIDPASLVLDPDEAVSGEGAALAEAHLQHRLAGMPVGRILGRREFFGLELALSAGTLEPRPDTEILVEAVLARVSPEAPLRIADLGTGTGAICLALLGRLPLALALAVDLSPDALATARGNALRHGLAGRVLFLQGDYAAALAPGLDVIVSNPPYISHAELAALDPGVRDHDPILALDGGADGLDAYRVLAPQCHDLLRHGGLLACEIGAAQGASVAGLFAAAGFQRIEIVQDLAGLDRVVLGWKI
ncbi:peptide chain release factor N(5)-glutamine methyltransferase [Microvirga tunisiensis]|uniref:Release factor glutamine methyltransferase n=2 Tax=Pannonibacter tanglangensis TaxID=2750084 RepID=A0A7X5F6B7_9HYPH|nr:MULTISPECIES: peptide chain release factor N(5)-glutamine methyltransferase [unclassified Pannonibacter]NBN66038.1 peptide chain release factor N(5)-glutamine methyltransferase [Pannonibacter sp. XCT-34]NBN80533.1 peptide chain release factor N(5)-glutamine methyltransferase [Pannonibacter sp. XCT-53]